MRAQNVLYLRDASLQISAKRFQLFGSKRRADDADLGLRIRVDPHQAQINIAFDYNVSAVTSATPRLGPAASLSLFIPAIASTLAGGAGRVTTQRTTTSSSNASA